MTMDDTEARTLIDSELGALRWFGSECLMCTNVTPGSRVCDNCKTDAHTEPLWISADVDEQQPGVSG